MGETESHRVRTRSEYAQLYYILWWRNKKGLMSDSRRYGLLERLMQVVETAPNLSDEDRRQVFHAGFTHQQNMDQEIRQGKRARLVPRLVIKIRARRRGNTRKLAAVS